MEVNLIMYVVCLGVGGYLSPGVSSYIFWRGNNNNDSERPWFLHGQIFIFPECTGLGRGLAGGIWAMH